MHDLVAFTNRSSADSAWTEEDDQQLCSLKPVQVLVQIAVQEAQQVHRGCDPLDVKASYQYYQVLYLIIIMCRRVLNMPMVNKPLSTWAESLATLLMVHHYGHPTHALTELRRRLRRLHIHPNMYTFTHFSQTNAVYWKQRVELRPDLPHSVNPQSDVYIGSHTALEELGAPQERSGTASEDYLNVSNTICPVVSGDTVAAPPPLGSGFLFGPCLKNGSF